MLAKIKNLISGNKDKVQKARSTYSITDIIVFVIAVIAITEFFCAAKLFQTGEDLRGFLTAGISGFIFLISMVFLAYSIYQEEKSKDNLRVSFFFFDWIESKVDMWKDSIAARRKVLKGELN